MSPRTGRPLKGETRRDLFLQIRVTKEELALLDECASYLNATRTDVVNKGIALVKKKVDAQKKKEHG